MIDIYNPEYEMHLEKMIAQRMQCLLSSEELLEVYRNFGGKVFRRSSALYGLQDALENNKITGDTCIEFGTFNGITSIILSKYFKRVITIDIIPSEIKHKIISKLGIKNIAMIDINDDSEKKEILENIKFDFAYLDGDHANRTQSDFELVKKCGRVLFHEYWKSQPPVWNLVNSLPKNEIVTEGFNFALWVKK